MDLEQASATSGPTALLGPRSLRQRIVYAIRFTLTSFFRAGVRAFRALGVLPRWSGSGESQHLLIIHLTPHLGDVILVMPMIEALRRANPNATIEFAVEATAAPLLEAMPELDRVYALPLGQEPPVRPFKAMARVLKVLRAYKHELRGVSPDTCIMPRWDNDQYRSNVLAWLIDAPRRIGFASDTVPGSRRAAYRDAFLTETVRGGSGMHEAEHFCLLAAEAGLIPPAAVASPGAVRSLQRIAALEDWPRLSGRLGIESARPFAVVAPGASMPRKVWPTDSWAEVCAEIMTMGLDVLLLSGPSDKAIAEDLHERCGRRTILAAGQTGLLESVALLAHASLFVGCDSGPGHIAGALGVPSTILFASTEGFDQDGVYSAQRIRPLGLQVACCCPPHNVPPCRGGCFSSKAHCITLIEPSTVIRGITSVLERTFVPLQQDVRR